MKYIGKLFNSNNSTQHFSLLLWFIIEKWAAPISEMANPYRKGTIYTYILS